MKCLHCGSCCLSKLSPLGSPCPQLEQRGNFYFCLRYKNRPRECSNHQYPFSICPIGQEVLSIVNSEQICKRIDTGYALLKFDMNDPEEAYNKLLNIG